VISFVTAYGPRSERASLSLASSSVRRRLVFSGPPSLASLLAASFINSALLYAVTNHWSGVGWLVGMAWTDARPPDSTRVVFAFVASSALTPRSCCRALSMKSGSMSMLSGFILVCHPVCFPRGFHASRANNGARRELSGFPGGGHVLPLRTHALL